MIRPNKTRIKLVSIEKSSAAITWGQVMNILLKYHWPESDFGEENGPGMEIVEWIR